MRLADPRLVVVQPVEMLEQLEVALDRQRRVLVVIVERREKDAAAQIEIVHAESSGGKPVAGDGRPSAWSLQANFPVPRVPVIMAAIILGGGKYVRARRQRDAGSSVALEWPDRDPVPPLHRSRPIPAPTGADLQRPYLEFSSSEFPDTEFRLLHSPPSQPSR